MKLGDIALFERTAALVAHRIVGSFYQDGCQWFREKGDNTFYPGTVPASSLIGRVIHIEFNGDTCDLTTLRNRLCGRLAGCYWFALFALMHGLSACRRKVACIGPVPRSLRMIVLSVFRVLSHLPARFMRS